jgi:hypothetical protein
MRPHIDYVQILAQRIGNNYHTFFFVYRRVKWDPTNFRVAFDKQVINSSDFFSKALNLAKP